VDRVQYVNLPFSPEINWDSMVPFVRAPRGNCNRFVESLVSLAKNSPLLDSLQRNLTQYRRLLAFGVGNPFLHELGAQAIPELLDEHSVWRPELIEFEGTDMLVRWALAHSRSE
jgi:hypothetical protein